MIRKIEVIYRRKTGVWARGSVYGSVSLVPIRDREIVFSKTYPKKEIPIMDIWDEIRSGMTKYFFEVFYPAVVEQTAPPEPPTPSPEMAIMRQSKHVREKQSRLPDYYMWNPEFGKWHMTPEGYARRTVEIGGPMDIGVAEEPTEYPLDYSLLTDMQKRFAGQTRTITLFVYPDKYDEEVRALFELRVTFW